MQSLNHSAAMDSDTHTPFERANGLNPRAASARHCDAITIACLLTQPNIGYEWSGKACVLTEFIAHLTPPSSSSSLFVVIIAAVLCCVALRHLGKRTLSRDGHRNGRDEGNKIVTAAIQTLDGCCTAAAARLLCDKSRKRHHKSIPPVPRRQVHTTSHRHATQIWTRDSLIRCALGTTDYGWRNVCATNIFV